MQKKSTRKSKKPKLDPEAELIKRLNNRYEFFAYILKYRFAEIIFFLTLTTIIVILFKIVGFDFLIHIFDLLNQ